MNKIFATGILASILLWNCDFAFAQSEKEDELGCTERLDNARNFYDEGKLQKVEATLQPCMENGFSKSQKSEAYQIIILTLQFDDRPKEADSMFQALLKHDPEFSIEGSNLPREFTHLYETYHAPPLWSAGIYFGPTFGIGQRIRSYSTGNSETEVSSYVTSGVGITVGARINRFITKDIEISGELQFLQQQIRIESEQFGFAKITSTERQSYFQIPIMGTYDFMHGRFEPFARLGIAPAFLLSAQATVERTYEGGSITELGDVTGPDVDMIDQRNTFNVASIIGAGIKYKVPRAFIIFEVRHNWYWINQAKQSERYSNPELTQQYLYLDDDFKLGNIQLLLGFTYSFHKIKFKGAESPASAE